MAPCFGRISYALLLLQLVPPRKWPKRFLWSIIFIQFLVDLGTVIISFSQCQPMYEFWGPNPRAHCWDPKIQRSTGYFQGCMRTFPRTKKLVKTNRKQLCAPLWISS
jgi:hypothetical protein